jgi:rhamnosyl/mannosyltransferase
MRILHLVKYFYNSHGGFETYVKDIVFSDLFSGSGFSFSVFCFGESNKDVVLYFNGVEVMVHVCKPWFYYKNQPIGIPFKRFVEVAYNHEIIHHHYPFPIFEILLLLPFRRKKFVMTWHGNIEKHRWGKFDFFYGKFITFVLVNSSRVIVTSRSVIDNSKYLNLFSNKVTVLPISHRPKENVVPRSFPSNGFNILFVGKLRLYKGVDILLKSISNLDVSLTIVGDGEELKNLEMLVVDMKLKSQVYFRRVLTERELDFEYKNADLFVLPSINEGEAFGIVQLEAMSYGLPVINTNVNSGVPFVSLNGKTGITVEPNNVDSLKKAIIGIMSNPLQYESFSANALVRVKDFDPKVVHSELFKIYKESIL